MTDEQLDAMCEEIKCFYLNGNAVENAPMSVLVDVRTQRLIASNRIKPPLIQFCYQIQTDATYSDVYDVLINPIATDLPSSVFLYKFQFESYGDVNTLKDQIKYFVPEEIKGERVQCLSMSLLYP